METRANYFLVGVFVIVLSAGVLGFVVWLAKFQFDTTFAHYDVVYKGSVTGLKEGSAVRFSGVKVGEVTKIRLDPEDARRVSHHRRGRQAHTGPNRHHGQPGV